MNKISVNFSKDVNNNYIVESISFKNRCLTEYSHCKDCCFYSGIKCHGHGDFFGSCIVYRIININADVSDDIVYDDSKCKVFQYLKSLDDDYNEYINSEE